VRREDAGERAQQLGTGRPRDDAPVARHRLVGAAEAVERLGEVLLDQPVAGVGAVGALEAAERRGGVTALEVEQAALQLEPGVRAHLLGRQLVLGLGVPPLGAGRVAGLGGEERQARQVVPAPLPPQHLLVAAAGRAVAPLLEVEIGGERPYPRVRRVRQPRQVLPRPRQAVQRGVELRAEEDEVGRRADGGQGALDGGLRGPQLGEVAAQRGVTVALHGEPPGRRRVVSRLFQLSDPPRQRVTLAVVIARRRRL